MSINIDYQPSEWRCVWLYPQRPNSLFNKIQTWEWLRQHDEDNWLEPEDNTNYPLDYTTHDDNISI